MTNFEPDDDHVTPRWVKVFGAVALVLLIVFAILHLRGGGFRGHNALAATGTERGAQP